MVRKTSRLRAAAAIGALCSALTGCSGEAEAPPEPEPEVLSASQAGGVYLDAVCPVNAAWDEADVELDRLRIAVGRGDEAQIDTRLFADAMGEVADASERAAERLETKQQEWPRGTETAVEAVRDTLESDRKQARKVAKLDAADAVGYAWLGAEESAAAAAGARTALGLPEDPIAACAQWEERSH
jgi:hypothetical protein